jgi:hypothetical protein
MGMILLSKITGLAQDEIDHFREAICGETNNQLKSTNLLAPAYNPSIDKADVKVNEPIVEVATASVVNN